MSIVYKDEDHRRKYKENPQNFKMIRYTVDEETGQILRILGRQTEIPGQYKKLSEEEELRFKLMLKMCEDTMVEDEYQLEG